MAQKPMLGARFDPDLEQRLRRYQRRRGLNQTDALVALVEQGLEADARNERRHAGPEGRHA